MKKIILITGSNRGIGYEIARQCGRLGFYVIISGRNADGVEAAVKKMIAEGIDAGSLLIDVSNLNSIESAAEQFAEMNLEIDVLVNNAGILLRGDYHLLGDEESILDQTLKTNSYGPLRVTKSFLPFMNSPGRIVMISSSGGVLNGETDGWSPAYCVSKTLLNAVTKHLAYELKQRKISVNAACPGWVRTSMGGSGASRSVEKGAETPVWLASEADQNLTGLFFRDKKVISW